LLEEPLQNDSRGGERRRRNEDNDSHNGVESKRPTKLADQNWLNSESFGAFLFLIMVISLGLLYIQVRGIGLRVQVPW
jgi:hypothetical protein